MLQIVSNSHILVFTREKHTITEHGNLTNWKSSGYFEMYHPVGKYRVKCFKFYGKQTIVLEKLKGDNE